MTLELSQVAPQVKAMGRSLAEQRSVRDEALQQAQTLLRQFSTEYTVLDDCIKRAEKVQRAQRFGWVGAAPTGEPLARAHPLPPCPEKVTAIASDGSQILPDQHAITLYYLINTGSIVYQHGSNRKPDTYNPKPLLCYEPDEIFDGQGRLISPGEVNIKRDLAELEVLTNLAQAYSRQSIEPVITLMDGQLSLRVIDLPFNQQQAYQDKYITKLNVLHESNALLAGYIDRPRSTFVLSLMHLTLLGLAGITEEALGQSPFRHLTDLDLFRFLDPGERSTTFMLKAKGLDKYNQAGHAIHFFYLNVSKNEAVPNLARVEIPAWLVADEPALDILHAAVVRQARINDNYPYVLARAHELAIISNEEREAVEMMLAVEMRRRGLRPTLSPKQYNKTLLTSRESFRL
jgi:hypothetical protein